MHNKLKEADILPIICWLDNEYSKALIKDIENTNVEY